jgi:hypothetical protein
MEECDRIIEGGIPLSDHAMQKLVACIDQCAFGSDADLQSIRDWALNHLGVSTSHSIAVGDQTECTAIALPDHLWWNLIDDVQSEIKCIAEFLQYDQSAEEGGLREKLNEYRSILAALETHFEIEESIAV